MIVIVGIYLVMVLLAIRMLYGVVRTSAGFAALALWGISHAWLGPIPMTYFAITREQRIRNGIAAVLYPVLATAFIALALIWLASIMAMVV